jgi:hypothetical protein
MSPSGPQLLPQLRPYGDIFIELPRGHSHGVVTRGDVPVDHGARQVTLAELGEDVEWGVLSHLTDELFALKEGVAEMVERYVAAHRHEFPTLYADDGLPMA